MSAVSTLQPPTSTPSSEPTNSTTPRYRRPSQDRVYNGCFSFGRLGLFSVGTGATSVAALFTSQTARHQTSSWLYVLLPLLSSVSMAAYRISAVERGDGCSYSVRVSLGWRHRYVQRRCASRMDVTCVASVTAIWVSR